MIKLFIFYTSFIMFTEINYTLELKKYGEKNKPIKFIVSIKV